MEVRTNTANAYLVLMISHSGLHRRQRTRRHCRLDFMYFFFGTVVVVYCTFFCVYVVSAIFQNPSVLLAYPFSLCTPSHFLFRALVTGLVMMYYHNVRPAIEFLLV